MSAVVASVVSFVGKGIVGEEVQTGNLCVAFPPGWSLTHLRSGLSAQRALKAGKAASESGSVNVKVEY